MGSGHDRTGRGDSGVRHRRFNHPPRGTRSCNGFGAGHSGSFVVSSFAMVGAMTAAKQLKEQPGPRPWYVTSAEYWRMVEAGVLEGQRVQLIKGVIVEMSPMQEPHALVVSRINRLL